MAKKKNPNEPEEDKNDQFDDDEDFGLPDLDYGALDDDKESEEEEAPAEPIQSESTEASEKPEKEADLDINEDELSADLDKEMSDSPNEPDFYEEETFEEFDESSAGADDSMFGSEQVEEDSYKEVVDTPPVSGDVFDSDTDDFLQDNAGSSKADAVDYQHKGSFTRIVVFGTITFVLIGFALLYFMGGSIFGDSTAKEDKTEKITEKKLAEKPKPTSENKEATEVAKPKPKPKPKPVAKPATVAKPGAITRLDNSTGKAYIVIASFFDEDMANDHANALASKGKSPMIIPPFKDYRFYRVAIAEFGSIREATAAIGQYKAEYGEEIWPLRY